MRAAYAASHFGECDRIPARAVGDEILLRWDCPRAWSSRRAADGRDPSIRLLVPFFLKCPHVATPPLSRGELVKGDRAPLLTTRYPAPGTRFPGPEDRNCKLGTAFFSGLWYREPVTGNPLQDYFEYNSTTSCSCAAIGMFGRDGLSSIRPLNVSRSTAIHESGAPRVD